MHTTYTTLIGVDISNFGDRRRDADAQRLLRERLYQHLRQSFEMSRLPWSECYREDRGDGALILTPLQVRPAAVLDPLAHHLTALLRRSNRFVNDLGRLRLRMALHTGEIQRDEHGILGQPITHLFRLLEAPAFKQCLAEIGEADVAMLVSQELYRHAAATGLIDPAAYRPIDVRHKETRTCGYLWLPPSYTTGR